MFDNEPRNREIIKNIEKAIDEDYNVVIWLSEIEEKDINDMIISGLTNVEITDIIHRNTFSGLQQNTIITLEKDLGENHVATGYSGQDATF